MTTEELLEKVKAGEVWFWSTGSLEDGDNAFTLVCPIIIQPEDMKRYQSAMDASLGLPVRMILHCPRCGFQHIDKEETEEEYAQRPMFKDRPDLFMKVERWMNPPHRKHLCLLCKLEFTPAKIPTVGVETL